VLVGSHQGGVDIEKVAAEHPDAIFKEPVDINKGKTGMVVANTHNPIN
jgi:succinyl-CoA synthetase beta subunit